MGYKNAFLKVFPDFRLKIYLKVLGWKIFDFSEQNFIFLTVLRFENLLFEKVKNAR